MALSTGAVEQIRSREKEQAVLTLVTISPPAKPVVRLVDNTEDVTSNGNLFTGFPVRVDLSADDGDTLQQVVLVFDNTTLEMIDWLRSVAEPIPVTLQTIFSDTPNTIEQSISDLIIRKVTYTANSITAVLLADDDLNQAIPSDIYDALSYPGLY